MFYSEILELWKVKYVFCSTCAFKTLGMCNMSNENYVCLLLDTHKKFLSLIKYPN